MPQYFFHLLHSGCEPVHDEEGVAFEDDAIARHEGMRSLGELMKEASSSGPIPFSVSVQIVREGVGIIDLLTGHLRVTAQP